MANIKQYKIEVNGVTESIKAVDALNESLKQLESRINALQSKTVNIGSKADGGGSKSSSKSSLSEEEKIQKQIEQIDEKRVAYSKEIYQNYLAAKDVLKETVNDQKSIAASERLQAKSYSNTISGMKQELADIKSAMQTVDLGDTDQMNKMTQRAKELNDALKKIEESYGQFGRNVGNYKDSLNNITVVIGGVAREFNNSKQALRALKQELDSLSAKEKGNTEYAKQLRREYNKLKSAIDDATKSSKFMDNALDTMQSFTALNQISQGFSTFFGMDNSEMERQIARLVALQNALQGLEKINKQIDSEEGIGKWLAKGSRGVDAFVTKITGAEKRMGLFIGKTRTASVAINGFAKVLKGIGAVGVTGGIMFLSSLFGETIDVLRKWVNSGIEAGEASKVLENSINTLTNTFERLKKENAKAYFEGFESETAYLKNNLNYINQQLNIMVGYLNDVKKFDKVEMSFGLTGGIKKTLADNLPDAKKELEKQLRYVEQWENDIENSLNPLRKVFANLFGEANQEKRNIQALGEAILNDFIYRVQQATQQAQKEIQETGKVSKDTAREIKDLNQEANEDFAVNSVLNNVSVFSKNGEFYAKQIGFVKTALEELNNTANEEALNTDYLVQLRIDSMKDGAAKIKAQNDLNRKKEIEAANGNLEAIALINKKYDNELKESLKSVNNAYRAALNDLNDLRIQNMREGLKKQLAQLDQEKKEKIQAIVADGHLVGQRTEEVNKLYNKKILNANKDWANEMKMVYQELYSNIDSLNKSILEEETNTARQNIGNKTSKRKENANSLNVADLQNIESKKLYYEEILKIELEGNKKLETANQEELNKLIDYNKKEEELRHDRVADAKTTSLVMEQIAKYESEKGIPFVTEDADVDWKKFEESLRDNLAKMRGELVDAYNEGKIDFKQFVEQIQDEQNAHNAKMNVIEKKYASDTEKNTIDSLEKKKQLYNDYYQNVIATIRVQQDRVADAMSKQPYKENDWGVVQISVTKRNYIKALAEYDKLSIEINDKKTKLKEDLNKKNITAEDFFMRNSELDAMQKSVDESIREIKNKQKMLAADFIQSIEMYIQAAANSFNQIMNAVWDAQDVAFDKEQEQIDKDNDALQDALDKQEEIIDKHKSEIDSIEDELASSRGDRRQHLIDQLNAEMEAERAAFKEKQRIEKEQQRQQDKQDALDLERKKAQYRRDKLQAIVNGAMAVTMAAVNNWPIPAIPMMALAGATTAAQIAIMSANKPYRVGGQLEGGLVTGKRHTQGGVPVGNTGIEVEGSEYIIRRESTSPNLNLLDFINKSQKKLDLSDFVEFYSDKPKRVIRDIHKRTFADGGYLPTLPSQLDIKDQLRDIYVMQDQRPVYVAVTDILNKADDVRNVQVLAGLNPSSI